MGLSKLGPPAIDALGALLADGDSSVRYSALSALCRMDAAAVVPHLRRALKTLDGYDRGLAESALERLKKKGIDGDR